MTATKASGLSGKAKLAGVIGWPVSHSRSPRLHGHWLAQYGIDGAYVPLAIRPDDFHGCVLALARMGFRGVNVTLPHKEQALAIADQVEPLAQRIGAANTLIFHSDGMIEARNTDAYGFLENLKQEAGAALDAAFARRNVALLLGAGGAARAAVAALLDHGVDTVIVANRNFARARDLALDLTQGLDAARVKPLAWSHAEDVIGEAGLLVNCTSLGMVGQPPLDVSLETLGPDVLVTDLVYTPLDTPFLQRAQAAGCRTVDGLGMLLHQAAPGFEAWFGVRPEVTAELRAAVLAG